LEKKLKNLFGILKVDRRKRYKKPLLLILIALCFILAPIFNTIYNAIFLNIPLLVVLKSYDFLAIILMTTLIITGIGLLFLKIWSWYLFLIQAAIIIIYNVFNIIEKANYYNVFILAQSLILFLLAGYFLRRDIFEPFFSKEFRGFRKAKRQQAEGTVQIDGEIYPILNISEKGFRVKWSNCPKKSGDPVQISNLERLGSYSAPSMGGITRIWEDEVSIAYRKEV
jgi:hypothetical protein